MRTMSDLKRKLIIGAPIKMVNYFGQTELETADERAKAKLGKVRYVVKVQTNGVYFSQNKEDKTGSYWEFPAASLIEVSDSGFKVYGVGERELNEKEKSIMANAPKDEQQDYVDAISDGSTMYWRRKRYYEDAGFGYLYNSSWQKGLYYNSNKNIVLDKSIKGNLELEYQFV